MEAKRPLGLMTIRTPVGNLETFTIYTHFQNGVDYLNTLGNAEGWENIGENEFKTGTGYVVRVEMIVPRFVDLRKEEYLWMAPLKDVKVNG